MRNQKTPVNVEAHVQYVLPYVEHVRVIKKSKDSKMEANTCACTLGFHKLTATNIYMYMYVVLHVWT